MYTPLALGLLILSASSSLASDATTLSPGKATAASVEADAKVDINPSSELTKLDRLLTQKQQDKKLGRLDAGSYQEFAVRFRTGLDQTIRRVPPTPLNLSLHARILARLGDSVQALTNLNESLKKDPRNPALITTKAGILYDQKNYAGAALAANEALRSDPQNLEAMWLKHASEGRTPNVKLPGSLWGTLPKEQSGSVASDPSPIADDRPLTPTVKTRAAAAPPAPAVRQSESKRKPDSSSSAGITGVMGAGMLLASGFLLLGDRTKLLIEDHPYAAIAATAGAVVLVGALVVGTGGGAGAAGGGMMLAAANGAPAVAASASAVSATEVLIGGAATGAAAGAILMNSDGHGSSNAPSDSINNQQSTKRKIKFGTDHAKPHFQDSGLDQTTIEDAIRRDLERQLDQGQTTVRGSFNGRISIAGRTIEYRGYGLPNGEINVGTYYHP